MARGPRISLGGYYYHVLNRGNARMGLFDCDEDYAAFERVLAEAHERVAMRVLGYCLMPNHWHLVLWPRNDGDLSEFMRWVGVTHTNRWHASHGTIGCGHVYQGRFKNFLIQRKRISRADRESGVVDVENPIYKVLHYIERNALSAGLVKRAENWRWSSLWRRFNKQAEACDWLVDVPGGIPVDWLGIVNMPQSEKELQALHKSVNRNCPYGEKIWTARTATKLGIESTLRPIGRPIKMAPSKVNNTNSTK